MIFIDPSELRQSSNLLKHLSDVVYVPLPDLEAMTGADVMISPDGLPKPHDETLLQFHIDQGAKLIQLKFGHDLSASIVDGRLNEALYRMLSTGAMSWQCLLLFVGIFSYDKTRGMAVINGQLPYNNPSMKWANVQAALNFWTERGGSIDFPLGSGKLIGMHFAIHQAHLNRFRDGESTRQLWPKAPVFYEEINSKNPYLKEWKEAQQLKVINDIRPLLCSIPGARIGPERATAIFEHMAENGFSQHFGGFLELLEGDILKVPGIGKKTAQALKDGLFKTVEERNKDE